MAPTPSDPLTLSSSAFSKDIAYGTDGVVYAAKAAVAGFDKLQNTAENKVFIVTGNILPFIPAVTKYLTLGVQKKASAYLVSTCPS